MRARDGYLFHSLSLYACLHRSGTQGGAVWTGNEHAEWEIFTYANALHQMLERTGTANADERVTAEWHLPRAQKTREIIQAMVVCSP
jgi:hypothetical protein